MKVLSLVLGIVLAISIASASFYNIEFNQVGDKIVVKESIDGIPLERYVDSEKLDRVGSEIYFVNKIIFNQSFDEVKIILNLDKGVIIQPEKVFPVGYSIESDGQTISIIWNLKNIKAGYIFAMFANLKDTKARQTWIYWLAGIVILAVIIVFIFYKRKPKIKIKAKPRKKEKTKERREEKYEYLLDTEKKVIELLKNADRHELWQKQIQNATGFSKAKVSRLVRNLEARGLVVKIPFGNTNKVRLK